MRTSKRPLDAAKENEGGAVTGGFLSHKTPGVA